MPGQVNLIVSSPAEGVASAEGAAAAAPHFLGLNKTIDIDALKLSLEDCLSKVGDVLSDLQQKTVAGWQLDNITVSLAISAEGSIGIATAGVEGSISVSFSKK